MKTSTPILGWNLLIQGTRFILSWGQKKSKLHRIKLNFSVKNDEIIKKAQPKHAQEENQKHPRHDCQISSYNLKLASFDTLEIHSLMLLA